MQTNIHIYVPAFGFQISGATVRSLMHLGGKFALKGVGASFATNSHPDIADHRNMALTLWYDTMPTSTHMLFVDADMGFPPELVLDLLAFTEANPAALAGAVYPKKTIDREWVVSGFGTDKQIEAKSGFLKVAGIGCGVMLIPRSLVAQMIAQYPELVDTRVSLHSVKSHGGQRLLRLFSPMDTSLGMLSEDLSFCHRWTSMGGEVWGNIAHKIEHWGMHGFIGCYGADNSKTAQEPGFAVKRGKRGVFKYNPNDTFIGRSLDQYGEWCDFELQLLEKIIKTGDIVVDVGANIGTHTVAFSNMVGPTGEVYAIEAQPRLFNLLCDNVKLNHLENVKAINGVVMEKHADKVCLNALPPDSVEFNFGAVPTHKVPGMADGDIVPGDTIDSLGLERCALIKIDVEGGEAAVLKGARETIGRFQPVLYIENNGDDSAAIWPVLADLGYIAYWSIGPYFSPDNHFKNQRNIWPGVVPSANICAVHQREKNIIPWLSTTLMGPHDNWRIAYERMIQQAAE